MTSRETGSETSERALARLRLLGLSVGVAALLAACAGVDLRGEGITSGSGTADPSLTTDVPTDEFGVRIVNGRRYVEAQSGDTVESLAARYGIEPATLASINRLPLGVNLQAGRIVELPSEPVAKGAPPEPLATTPSETAGESGFETSPSVNREPAVEATPLANPELAVEAAPASDRISEIASLAIGDKEEQPEPAVQSQPAGLPTTSEVVHIARAGETAFSIAEFYGISVQALANWNSLAPPQYPVRLNQRLLVPQVTIEANAEREATVAAEAAPQGLELAEPAIQSQPTGLPRTSEVVHIVRAGETAFSIADSYGISIQVLANWNSLAPPQYPVRLNQRLLVPQVTIEANAEREATATAGSAPQRRETAEAGLDPRASGQNAAAAEEAPETADPEPAATASVETAPSIDEVQTERDFIMPVQGEIILGYSGQPGGNEGINIFATEGTPVAASGDGTVAIVSPRTNGTTIVLIRHKEDFHTVYTNLKDVTVQKDQLVAQGQIIGSVAGGGNDFLHFEIRIGTQSTDPVPYLQGGSS